MHRTKVRVVAGLALVAVVAALVAVLGAASRPSAHRAPQVAFTLKNNPLALEGESSRSIIGLPESARSSELSGEAED